MPNSPQPSNNPGKAFQHPVINEKDLSTLYHLTSKAAAKKLDISESSIKQKRAPLKRWPNRKFKSLFSLLKNLTDLLKVAIERNQNENHALKNKINTHLENVVKIARELMDSPNTDYRLLMPKYKNNRIKAFITNNLEHLNNTPIADHNPANKDLIDAITNAQNEKENCHTIIDNYSNAQTLLEKTLTKPENKVNQANHTRLPTSLLSMLEKRSRASFTETNLDKEPSSAISFDEWQKKNKTNEEPPVKKQKLEKYYKACMGAISYQWSSPVKKAANSTVTPEPSTAQSYSSPK